MRRYRYEIDNVRAHPRSLWAVIAIQVVIIAALWFGWSRAPERLTVHIPPDLRSGATLAVDEVSPPTSMPSPSTSSSSSTVGRRTAPRTMGEPSSVSRLISRPVIAPT